jgi:hypothetical protein
MRQYVKQVGRNGVNTEVGVAHVAQQCVNVGGKLPAQHQHAFPLERQAVAQRLRAAHEGRTGAAFWRVHDHQSLAVQAKSYTAQALTRRAPDAALCCPFNTEWTGAVHQEDKHDKVFGSQVASE